jgi:hypothetical protein
MQIVKKYVKNLEKYLGLSVHGYALTAVIMHYRFYFFVTTFGQDPKVFRTHHLIFIISDL